MSKANPLRPGKVKDPIVRKDLAEKLTTIILSGQGAKKGLHDRWKACEAAYRGQPDEQGIKVTEDSQPHAANIVKPRIDALVTKTCNPITSQRPYFSAFGYRSDRNRLKTNEETIQFLYERAHFPRKFREGTRLSCMAAPAIFKVPFRIELADFHAGQSEDSQDLPQPFKYVGPALQVIHPNDFCVYPLSTGGVTKAKLVADRSSLRVRDIKELQKADFYFDTETIYGGDDPQSWESGRDPDWSLTSEASGIVEPDDEMVEIWDGIVKWDLDEDGYEERYRFVIAITSQVLLEFEQYGAMMDDGMGSTAFVPYSRPWYFPHAPNMPGYGEFFHSTPIVQDLMAPQAAYSDGMTLLIEGGKMMAFPAGFVKGGKLSDKVKRYEPGEYHYLEAGQEVTFVDPKFNPSVWPLLFQVIKNDADGLVRISQNGVAQATGKTASESVILNNNMEEGADEYRDVAAMSAEEMCDFVRELAFIHYDLLLEAYGDQFPCQDRFVLQSPLRWEAAGKTSDTNPQIMGQNIQEVLQLLQNPITLQLLMASGVNLPNLIKGWLKTKRWPIPDSDLFIEQESPLDQQTAGVPLDPGMGADSGLPQDPMGGGLPPMQNGGGIPGTL
jgi:hypothetical protein